MIIDISKNEVCDRTKLIKTLVSLQYKRNDHNFNRGNFRVISLAFLSFLAFCICFITLTCVDAGLPPHTKITSATDISLGSGPVNLPTIEVLG